VSCTASALTQNFPDYLFVDVAPWQVYYILPFKPLKSKQKFSTVGIFMTTAVLLRSYASKIQEFTLEKNASNEVNPI
jgi:hypothetical protein